LSHTFGRISTGGKKEGMKFYHRKILQLRSGLDDQREYSRILIVQRSDITELYSVVFVTSFECLSPTTGIKGVNPILFFY